MSFSNFWLITSCDRRFIDVLEISLTFSGTKRNSERLFLPWLFGNGFWYTQDGRANTEYGTLKLLLTIFFH